MEGKASPRKPTKERLLEFKGQIKKACDESVREPDVVQNIAITDALNENPFLDERADKTLRKLIVHKSAQIAINAINLLQCILQNCEHFLPYVAKEAFMETLKKNIPKRFYLQQVIQMKSHPDLLESERIDKTLILLLNLSKLEYPIFKRYYEKLVAKGIKFPEAQDDEILIIGKPKSTAHPKPKPISEKKGQSARGVSSPKPNGEQKDKKEGGPVSIPITDPECKTYCDHAKVLADLLTESAPTTNLSTDEITQQLLNVVKQGVRTIGIRIGRDNPEQLMSQLMFTYEELTHSQDYYQGLVDGKAVRSHHKNDRFRTGGKQPESQPESPPVSVDPIPEKEMSKLSEQQQLDLAMKQSLRLQQDAEEKRKKESAEAELKAKKDQEEKKKSSEGFDDLFGDLMSFDTKGKPAPTSKPETKGGPTTKGPTNTGDLLDLSFLDTPNPTPAGPTNSTVKSPATTAPASTSTAGANPFDDDEQEPGTEGKEGAADSSDEEGAGPEGGGFDPFAELATRALGPSGKGTNSNASAPAPKKKPATTDADDPFLALASSRADDEDSD